MTAKDQATLRAEVDTTFAVESPGDITGAELRGFLRDFIDSAMWYDVTVSLPFDGDNTPAEGDFLALGADNTIAAADVANFSSAQLDALAVSLMQRMATNTAAGDGAILYFRAPDESNTKPYEFYPPRPLGKATKEELWAFNVHESKVITSEVWRDANRTQAIEFTSSWTPDLDAFFNAEMTVTESMTINLPINMNEGQAGFITLLLDDDVTIQFASGDLDNFLGGSDVVFPSASGDRCTLQYRCVSSTQVEVERRFAGPAASGGTVAGPTLTSAVDTANGADAGAGSVYTTGTSGTLYWVCLLTADDTPSAANVKAGKKSNGSTDAEDSGSETVTGAGTQVLSPGPASLSASTGYKIAYMHEDSLGNQSSVVVGDGFTTAAASGSSVAHLGSFLVNEYTTSINLGSYTAGRVIRLIMSQTNAFGTVSLGSDTNMTPTLSVSAGGKFFNVYTSTITTEGSVNLTRSAYPAFGKTDAWATFGAGTGIYDSDSDGDAASNTTSGSLSLDIPANGVVMVSGYRWNDITAPSNLDANQHVGGYYTASEDNYGSTVAPETITLTVGSAGTYKSALAISVEAA